MAKEGEITILRKQGDTAVQFGLHKPFSSPRCAQLLLRIGAVMAKLPPPPARLLDLGCGMGWTSLFFAQRGYDVVGVDISPDKIHYANTRKAQEKLSNVAFTVSDYEELNYHNEFDCAVFFDALHHAMDEELAVRMTFRALKPGGRCVLVEPGVGHSQSAGAVDAVERFQVTEKDMPASRVRQIAAKAGFRRCHVLPEPDAVWELACPQISGTQSFLKRSHWWHIVGSLYRVWRLLRGLESSGGLVVLNK